jgi:hypothetical protein
VINTKRAKKLTIHRSFEEEDSHKPDTKIGTMPHNGTVIYQAATLLLATKLRTPTQIRTDKEDSKKSDPFFKGRDKLKGCKKSEKANKIPIDAHTVHAGTSKYTYGDINM